MTRKKMNNLSFQKFKKTINERRFVEPEKGDLSPTMKVAVNDIYNMIDNTPDPLENKIEGIIETIAKKHNIKVSAIEDYFDNEILN